MAALFSGPAFRALEIVAADIPELQRFFDENPEYFLRTGGQGPRRDEAAAEFADRPPPGWSFGRKWMIRIVDDRDAMVGVAVVVTNLLAEGVWHIGLFIVATALHGTGAARAMYRELESWMRRGGARWLRLGAVVGNGRAERFWESVGYAEVRRREGVEIGRQVNAVRVMLKPVAGGTVADYLALVPRDRPQAP
jgi:ribosomal protein S18 acetylase RimI-like enzyme